MTFDDCYSPEESRRLLSQGTGIADRQHEAHWDRERVRWRMRRGAYVLCRSTSSPKPGERLTFWPDWALYRDMDAFERNARQEGYSSKTRRPEGRRESFTPSEISDAEIAAQWLQAYLSAEAHVRPRKALQLYLWCDIRRLSMRDFCERIGLRKSAAYELTNKGLDIILSGVIGDGLLP